MTTQEYLQQYIGQLVLQTAGLQAEIDSLRASAQTVNKSEEKPKDA